MSIVTAGRVAGPKLLDLVPSFQRHLKAENKSPKTITSYTEAVRRLHDFLTINGMPLEVASITSEHIETFMADQLERLRPARKREESPMWWRNREVEDRLFEGEEAVAHAYVIGGGGGPKVVWACKTCARS